MNSFANSPATGRKLTQDDPIQAAWDNVPSLFGYTILKLDCDGRLISRFEYGKLSTLGWKIDHLIPIFLGGSDAQWNLRARHHLGNRAASGISAALAKELGT